MGGLKAGRLVRSKIVRGWGRFFDNANVREHDLMGEYRNPFEGCGAVGVAAADEFMLADSLSGQPSAAESADFPSAESRREEFDQFHIHAL